MVECCVVVVEEVIEIIIELCVDARRNVEASVRVVEYFRREFCCCEFEFVVCEIYV